MPKVTGNDLVAQSLKNEGVNTVFYLTGGPMSDVARLCIEMQLKSIDVRHEQAAAMMAHAYSRLTGKPGICFASSGPGTTNLLTGIGNSFLDATPVVALGGSSPITQNSRGVFQEIDQLSIFKPVKIAEDLGCHGEHVEKPDEIRPSLERAQIAIHAGKPAVVNVVTDPRARSQTVRFSTYQPI